MTDGAQVGAARAASLDSSGGWASGPHSAGPWPSTARSDLMRLAASPERWAPPLRSGEPGQQRAASRRAGVLVLFGLMEETDADPARADVDLLLTRRSSSLSHHPGQIAFPGGGLEAGESAAQAAVREAQEETGLDPGGVEVLGTLADVPLVVSDNLVTPVLAWWTAPSDLRVDGTEAVDAFRVPVPQLLDPERRGVVVLDRVGAGGTRRGFRTPAFAVGGHVVWGFTAYVIDALLDALGWTRPWDPERVIPLPGLA